MTPPSTKKIHVAVIGGGLGGLSLALALLKRPNITLTIYEAAHKFSEVGAGVAFGPNSQRALALIGPEVEAAFLSQATYNGWPELKNLYIEYRYGMADAREEELLSQPMNETGAVTVHRAKLLDALVALVPEGVARFGKRLEEVEELGERGVRLRFADGTTAEADCVVGADGVHSAVRRHLLGEGHPALNAVFSGSVAYRGLIPMDKARATLGERYAENTLMWVGQGGCVMTMPIDFGKTMNVVAINSSYKSWEGAWVQKADMAKVESEFSHWGKMARKIVGLLAAPEVNVMAWSLWDHPRAPFYYSGKVVMMGDAAHAMTPFQGQGAGQAVEDAYVLSSMFDKVDSVDKLPLAFQAYDTIRRPRSQMVAKTSREAGELCSLRLSGVEDNAEAFNENTCWRWEWIWHRDIAGERMEALGVFDRLLKPAATGLRD